MVQFNKIGHVHRRQSLITDQLLCKIEYADVAQLAEQLICNQQVIGSSPIIGFVSERDGNLISRGGAVWKLVGLITRRSQVQILLPQLTHCIYADVSNAQIAQLVEQRTENPRVTGSIPVLGIFLCYKIFISAENKTEYGRVAQVVEHLTFNQVVRGSNPRTLTLYTCWKCCITRISGFFILLEKSAGLLHK